MATINDAAKRKVAKDKDLESEKHDEILNWLYRNAAGLLGGTGKDTYHSHYANEIMEQAHDELQGVVNQLKGGMECFGQMKRDHYHRYVPNNSQEVEWLKKQIAFYEQFVDDDAKFKEFLGPVPNFPGVIVNQVKIQSPIYDNSSKRNSFSHNEKKIIGFMDMEAEIRNPNLSIGGINSRYRKNTETWSAPEMKFHTTFDSKSTTYYFDVRTSVANIGVLMREIEVLRNALEVNGVFSGVYAVVAPQTENSFRILENQDIKPIDYDPEIEFDPEDFVSDKELKKSLHEYENKYELIRHPVFFRN